MWSQRSDVETQKSELKMLLQQWKYLHAVVLLLDVLQVLLELLQLNEAIFCKLCVLLQLTVHLLKLFKEIKCEPI